MKSVCAGFTCVSVSSIQAGEGDVILSSVGPIDAVVDKVQREAVGPRDLVLHNHLPVGAVHPDPADVRAIAPVGPIQVPVPEMSRWARIIGIEM